MYFYFFYVRLTRMAVNKYYYYYYYYYMPMLLALVTACVGDSNYYVGACAGRNSSGNFSGDTGTVEARDASLQLRTTASVTDSDMLACL